MADSFGLKIGLEGEKEFKKALSEINQSFKVLGSEMKLVSSQFDKNDKSVQALSARNSVLNKEIEAQKSKIETLRAALQNASDSFGETDRRTQNWQIQLNNAEAALNDMERELSDNNAALEEANSNYGRAGDALEDMDSEMDDVTDSADDMGDEIDEAGDAAEKSESKFKGLGTVLKTVGAAMGAVVVAAGAAAVKLGKEVVEAYADYEQLVGGVDTLFKDSSQELQSYAANAYKTAGMSANDYMETVTGFSASLIQSLGGDTEKAVKYADMAITDMSDNANKMGTDMASIQNAYQGFAKQNYTMLDNLKLGYGGTKEEMERLLADAQAISGIEYDISSYADVVDAIHVIQTSMDITGTTAKEAEHTISGSINSMQAAIQNLIVGFGDANADIGMLCGNVVDAFQDVLTNITPVIENIIAALPTALNALITTVGELLPTILETVVSLFTEVLTTILNLLPSLIPAAVQAVMTIVNALIENLPLLIEAAIQLVATLVQGIADALPTLIPAAVEAIVTIVQGLVDNLPMLLDAALQLITGLAQGLLDALPVLIAALPDIISAIVDFIVESIPQIIDAGIQLLTSLITALPQIITAIVAAIPQIIDGIITAVLNAIPQIIQAGIDLLIALIQALPQIISTIVQAIPQIISGIVNALIGNIDKIILAGVQLFVALIKNLPTIIVEIVKAVPQIIAAIVKGFASGVSQMASIGLNLIKGIWIGISDAASWLWSKVSGFCSNLMSKIKGFFGIHSPSKEMAWIGDMLTQGLANGIDESAKVAVNAAQSLNEGIMGVMDSLADDMQTAVPSSFNLDADATVRSAASGVLGKAASAFTIALNITNFNNYSSEDIRQLTNEVMETASQFAQRKGVVFA
ncbi:MAG: phage tail protein [Eubacteriales bacterium]|nr:phage tail protein [Eubacteriales bacterium]